MIHRDLKPENIDGRSIRRNPGDGLVLGKILPKKNWRKKGGKPGGGLPGVKPKTIFERGCLLRPLYVRVVGDTGLEPVTSSV